MLIQYLRSLLGLFVSKKETAFIADQGMPGVTRTQVAPSSTSTVDWSEVATYVAPCSGTLVLSATSSTTGAFIELLVDNSTASGTTFPWVSFPGSCCIDLRKGARISAYAVSVSAIKMEFIHSVGSS